MMRTSTFHRFAPPTASTTPSGSAAKPFHLGGPAAIPLTSSREQRAAGGLDEFAGMAFGAPVKAPFLMA